MDQDGKGRKIFDYQEEERIVARARQANFDAAGVRAAAAQEGRPQAKDQAAVEEGRKDDPVSQWEKLEGNAKNQMHTIALWKENDKDPFMTVAGVCRNPETMWFLIASQPGGEDLLRETKNLYAIPDPPFGMMKTGYSFDHYLHGNRKMDEGETK